MWLDQSHKDNQHRLIKIKCALVPIVIGVILPLVSVYSHRSGISSYLRVLRIRAWTFLESTHVSIFRVIIMPTSHPPVPHPLCYCCHIFYIYMCSKHIEHHYCFCLRQLSFRTIKNKDKTSFCVYFHSSHFQTINYFL